MTQVVLTVAERDFVKQAGTARHEANKYRSDIADYDSRRFNLKPITANRLGVFAEAVAFKFLGGDILTHSLEEWAHFVPNNHPKYNEYIKGQADINLGQPVEVRRANSPDSPIPVRDKDKRDGAVLLQVHVPYMQASRGDNITVFAHAFVTGWAKPTDKGTVPGWSKGSSIVVNRRPLDSLDLSAYGRLS